MKSQSKFNIVYTGYDIHTFMLLFQHREFEIRGVNLVPEFLTLKTYNPINHLFRLIYRFRKANRLRSIEVLLVIFFKYLSPFSSSIFKKYRDYLSLLVQKKIQIIDLSDPKDAAPKLHQMNTDLMVVNNWWLLPESIINAPNYGTINIHPSLLPQYRGSLPTLWSLKNRDPFSAVSYMLLNSEMDRGNLLAQHPFPLSSQDDAISVEKKIEDIVSKTLIQDLKAYLTGKLIPFRQDHSKSSKTAKFLDYQMISWNQERAIDIVNKVNLYPYLWPLDLCHAYFGEKKIFFKSAKISKNTSDDSLIKIKPGTIYRKGKKLYAKTIDDLVKIDLNTSVTPEDRRWLMENIKPL